MRKTLQLKCILRNQSSVPYILENIDLDHTHLFYSPVNQFEAHKIYKIKFIALSLLSTLSIIYFLKSFINEEPISYLTQFSLFLDSLDHLIFSPLGFSSSLPLCYTVLQAQSQCHALSERSCCMEFSNHCSTNDLPGEPAILVTP